MKKSEKYWSFFTILPGLLVLAAIPLVVLAHRYEIGLNDYRWFSNSETGLDVFLYWRSRFLVVLAILMAVCVPLSITGSRKMAECKDKWKTLPVLCAGVYLLFAVLSTIFSEFHEFALTGLYEQQEGLNVLAAYVIVFLYMYTMTDSQRTLRILLYALLMGGFFVGLIGTLQYYGLDFFRSDAGMWFMNLLNEEKMNFKFNFEEGWVYTTLYNPNYVGSYVALLLPVSLSVLVTRRKEIPIFWVIVSALTSVLLIISLIGSRSLTGCIGLIGTAVLFLIMVLPRMWKKAGRGRRITAAVVAAVLFAGVLFVFPEQIKAGTDKLFHPKENNNRTEKMLSTQDGLQITTNEGVVLYVEVLDDKPDTPVFKDAQGAVLNAESKGSYYVISDERFDDFRFYPISIIADNAYRHGVKVVNFFIGKIWQILKVDGEYKIYTKHKKLDSLEEIESWGFENSQWFGDKRGYIWSRTFPLLKNYLFVGSGPNTYSLVYPQNDYVGKTNMNYDGTVVTKPHNMYLQIWVQTGFLSLLAFLALFAIYFADGIRLYGRHRQEGTAAVLGMAVWLGLTGYMITGLANDSTVTVAPVFWAMLGIGYAVNYYIRKMPSAIEMKMRKLKE